jgi:hypothetical protein
MDQRVPFFAATPAERCAKAVNVTDRVIARMRREFRICGMRAIYGSLAPL